ncbi:MAG: carboxypeptidase-like regulatory domain-containing protein [Acidobacteriota bacterium]
MGIKKSILVLALILGLNVFINAQTAVLTGLVYDATGAVIIGAKVSAKTLINKKLQTFETKTDADGEYKLDLPFQFYDTKSPNGDFKISEYTIKVESPHFEPFELKDFKFVPSYKGQMNLDFALDVQSSINIITIDSTKKKK